MNREQRRKMEQASAKATKSKKSKTVDLSKLRAKTNGEVFTPTKLAEEMIDQLPADSFTNKKLTFLDPCFGATAVFPIMLMFRLADGLRDAIPNSAERVKHIVEQMLYMAEKDPDACEFGVGMMQTYAKLLSTFLMIHDSPDTVTAIKGKYVEHYEGIIENFYETIGKKGDQAEKLGGSK